MSGTRGLEFGPGDRNSLRVVAPRRACDVRPLRPFRQGQFGGQLLYTALAAKKRDLWKGGRNRKGEMVGG